MAKRSGIAMINFPDGRSVESTPETRAEADKLTAEIHKKRAADEKKAAAKQTTKNTDKEA